MRTLIGLVAVLSLLAGCAPTPEQIAEAIKAKPDVFFEAVEEAQNKYRDIARQKQEQKMMDELEKDFKNPLKPETPADRTYFGPSSAKVTIVEFSDFECPYCSRGFQTVKQVMATYGDQVRVLYKHLPLEQIHPNAKIAAQYFEAIGMQDAKKAEKFHDTLFENQRSIKQGESYLKEVAKKVGADMNKLKKDVNSDAVLQRIAKDVQEAEKFGISGTPGFIVNGVALRGAMPFDMFKKVIDRHLGK
jgi:protein-disulfide isomerase